MQGGDDCQFGVIQGTKDGLCTMVPRDGVQDKEMAEGLDGQCWEAMALLIESARGSRGLEIKSE